MKQKKLIKFQIHDEIYTGEVLKEYATKYLVQFKEQIQEKKVVYFDNILKSDWHRIIGE